MNHQPPTAKEIVKNFANSTTLHGVPRILLSARSTSVRCLWAVICLAAAGLFSSQIVDVFQRYFSYPKKVTVEVVPMPASFPAVSFCNMRNLDFTVLNTINRMVMKFNSKGDSGTAASNNTFIDEYFKFIASIDPLYFSSTNVHTKSNWTTSIERYISRASLSANIDKEIISLAAIQLDELIVSCQYGGQSCDLQKEFHSFFDQSYFNCYTFDISKTLGGNSKEISLSYGVGNGLSVVVLTGSGMLDRNGHVFPGLQEKSNALALSDGVRVVIHPTDMKPFPLDEGFDVPPGYSTSFGISPRSNMRLGKPYGNCTQSNAQDENQNSTESGIFGYRFISCQKSCIQKLIIKECGCYDNSLPKNNIEDFKACHSKKSFFGQKIENGHFFQRMRCMQLVQSRVNRNFTLLAQCDCHPLCNELSYDVTYSISKWPTAGFGTQIAQAQLLSGQRYVRTLKQVRLRALNELAFEKDWSLYFNGTNREEALKNFARINVYVSDVSMIQTVESPDYMANQLISDMGGQLGVWVGVSVITLAEVIELMITLFAHILSKMKFRSDKANHANRENASVISDPDVVEVDEPVPV